MLSPGGGGRPLVLPRRRDPINVAARGFNQYGSAWVSAQLAAFLFDRLTPNTRREIARRRASIGVTRTDVAASGAPPRPSPLACTSAAATRASAGASAPPTLHPNRGRAARLRELYDAARADALTTRPSRLAPRARDGFRCTSPSKSSAGSSRGARRLRPRRPARDGHTLRLQRSHSRGAGRHGHARGLRRLRDARLRSCFARVAYALATARKGRPPPIISLEAPRDSVQGVQTGDEVDGARDAWRRGKQAAMLRPKTARAEWPRPGHRGRDIVPRRRNEAFAERRKIDATRT